MSETAPQHDAFQPDDPNSRAPIPVDAWKIAPLTKTSQERVWQRLQEAEVPQPVRAIRNENCRLSTGRMLWPLSTAAVIALYLGFGYWTLSRPNSWPANSEVSKELAGEGETPAQLHTPLTPEEKARLEDWAKKLISEDFEEREAAAKALEDFGERALSMLEPLTKSQDTELSTRSARLIKRIGLNAVLASLEKLSGVADKGLGVDDPEKRQKAVFEWCNSVDKQKAAPIVVELSGRLDSGPLLWAIWEILSTWTVPEELLKMTEANKRAFSGLDPASVTDRLKWLCANDRPIQFSDQAERLCNGISSPPQINQAALPLVIAIQLRNTGTGLCIAEDGTLHVLTPTEGAQFWKAWWSKVQGTANWRSKDPSHPTQENIAAWLGSLSGGDSRHIARDSLRILDTLELGSVRRAVTALANGTGEAATRARGILSRAELRSAGSILFNDQDLDEGQTAWIMNADGSQQRPLFEKHSGVPALSVLWSHGKYVFLSGRDGGLYWWRPGMARPCAVDAKANNLTGLREGTSHVYYLRTFGEGNAAKELGIHDLASNQAVPIPLALRGPLTTLTLSQDGRQVAFTRDHAESDTRGAGGHSVWTFDLTTGELKERLKLKPDF